MTQDRRLINLIITGSGKAAKRLLVEMSELSGVKVHGLLDPGGSSKGIRLAKELSLPYGTDIKEFARLKSVDVIVDTSHDADLIKKLERSKPETAMLVSGAGTDLIQALARVTELRFHAQGPCEPAESNEPESGGLRIVGKSIQMQEVLDLVEQVAPTPTNVLLLGETGTGKDLIARTIHQASPLKDKPFVSINCTALTASLAESELFGYTKGAFTGAERDRKGLLEEASGGTLFLDEIGDMQLELQAKMLRFLQTGEIRRVGSTRVGHVTVRVIAATNRNLEEAVAKGNFRKDLYYRFNTFTIQLPPLRERPKDIPYLAYHFVTRAEVKLNKRVEDISDEALELMMVYDWPGNVREMENVIERAVILCHGRIEKNHLPLQIGGASDSMESKARQRQAPKVGLDFQENRDRVVARFEKKEIEHYLRQAEGNVSEASRLSGIPRRTFYRKMRKYGIRDE